MEEFKAHTYKILFVINKIRLTKRCSTCISNHNVFIQIFYINHQTVNKLQGIVKFLSKSVAQQPTHCLK